jgi:hypothetical protein
MERRNESTIRKPKLATQLSTLCQEISNLSHSTSGEGRGGFTYSASLSPARSSLPYSHLRVEKYSDNNLHSNCNY